MKKLMFLLTVALFCCKQEVKENNEIAADTIPPEQSLDLAKADTVDSEISTSDDDELENINETDTFFIVVADTSQDYYELRKHLLNLKKYTGLEIDSLGREYNQKKGLIALPENDEDEIYAGEYYPRRFPSTTLSLEYLISYKRSAPEKTIALVTGIYETHQQADSALHKIKERSSKAFALEAEMYVGCIH